MKKSQQIAAAIEKMLAFYRGNQADIQHFLKVWALAKTIGEQEQLEESLQQTLELAAVVHDIACPLCREKYGNTHGKHQEAESAPLLEAFFQGLPVDPAVLPRVTDLVCHHHTYADVNGIDYRILLEADFLVNAAESGYSQRVVESARKRVFRTETGLRLLREMYGLPQ